ncbi:TIGR04282 family arsenosugar biosynthesis glycosyltransferase [Streptomyces sp. NPDC004779]
MTALLVIAKQPLPGRVKTRLTPPFTPAQAAALAEAALADTLSVAARVPCDRHVLVLEGEPGDWKPPCFEVVRQASGGLDARLAAAFGGCDGPALLIGMDTPQVTPALLTPAVRGDTYDAWFGPATDGGFWALGLRSPDPSLLLGVPMSRPDTGPILYERLLAAGLNVGRLPVLRDVDTADDARIVASEAPGTRFAALHAELSPTRAGVRT